MASRRLAGKVALVTGAARGQGKSHCVRLAQEGAAIIAVDIAAQIPTVDYPLGSPEDLADTVDQVEAAGGKILAAKADVRERGELRQAVTAGVELFGRLDIVCANAGILPLKRPFEPQQFVDAMDVDFGGVMNAVGVATCQAMPIPYIEPGDISNVVAFLASDEARYITGINLRVDAGAIVKAPGGLQG